MQNISIKTSNNEILEFLSRIYPQKPEDNDVFGIYTDDLNIVAGDLSKILVDVYEKKLIYKIINHTYKEYSLADRKAIYNSVIDYIYDSKYEFSEYFRKLRYHIIFDSLINYLNNSNFINIEGFVNFRLGDYIDELVDIISACQQEFIIDREYDIFIDMMRDYVSTQKPIYKKMEVVISDDDFVVLNELGENITNDCVLNCVSNDLDLVVKFEDLFLNMLIINAPSKIVIHDRLNLLQKEIVTTVSKIFQGRIRICHGCEICNI